MTGGETARTRLRTDRTITIGIEITRKTVRDVHVLLKIAVVMATNPQDTELDGTQFVNGEVSGVFRAHFVRDFGAASVR